VLAQTLMNQIEKQDFRAPDNHCLHYSANWVNLRRIVDALQQKLGKMEAELQAANKRIQNLSQELRASQPWPPNARIR